MITFYDVAESALASKAFEAEALYFCSDTLNLYFDSPVEGSRIRMSTDIIILADENARNNILAPFPFKIYCVLSTGSLYIYNDGKWNRLGTSQFDIHNVVVENGSLTVTDDRITEADTAQFYPDLSVIDLASNISTTCTKGSVTVNLTSSYPIPGIIKIN